MLASPYLWIAAGLAVAGAMGGAYVKGRGDGRAVEIAERMTLEEVVRESREASMQAAAEAIAKISVVHTTIRQKAEVITRENVIYRDCRNGAELVRLLDDARASREPTESTHSGELPGTGASPAPDVR